MLAFLSTRLLVRRWFLTFLVVLGCHALKLSSDRPAARQRRSSLSMCICIDCALVERCTAYHLVEAKHGQPHLATEPDFTPRPGSPTVAVMVNSTDASPDFDVELDVTKCEDYLEDKGRWLRMMPPGTLLKAGFSPDFVPT